MRRVQELPEIPTVPARHEIDSYSKGLRDRTDAIDVDRPRAAAPPRSSLDTVACETRAFPATSNCRHPC